MEENFRVALKEIADNFGAECIKGEMKENLSILAGETKEKCLDLLIVHLGITKEQSKTNHIGNLILKLENMDAGIKANYLCFLHIIRFYEDDDEDRVQMRLRSFLGYLMPKFHGVKEDQTELVQNMVAKHTGDIDGLAGAVKAYQNPVGMQSFYQN